MIVAPITSPGRFPPFVPSGMRGAFHQRPDQSQECLVLWSVPILAEERCEFDIRALSARRGVRTVRDKHFVGLVITDEMPTITVGAVIQLSHMMRHTFLHRMPTAKHMGMTAAERQPVGINRGTTRRRKEVPPLARRWRICTNARRVAAAGGADPQSRTCSTVPGSRDTWALNLPPRRDPLPMLNRSTTSVLAHGMTWDGLRLTGHRSALGETAIEALAL